MLLMHWAQQPLPAPSKLLAVRYLVILSSIACSSTVNFMHLIAERFDRFNVFPVDDHETLLIF